MADVLSFLEPLHPKFPTPYFMPIRSKKSLLHWHYEDRELLVLAA